MLPQEQNPETGTEALVSPELRPIAMRGLLDPALRDGTWPRDMAWLVIGGMEHASYANGNRVMVLDLSLIHIWMTRRQGMDEPNMEADGGQQERQAKNEKTWKAYPPETYRNTIAEDVYKRQSKFRDG